MNIRIGTLGMQKEVETKERPSEMTHDTCMHITTWPQLQPLIIATVHYRGRPFCTRPTP